MDLEDDFDPNLPQKEFFSLRIEAEFVELVKKRCIDLRKAVSDQIEYPLLEEYDFRNDEIVDNLGIDLKPTTLIRPYQV